MKGKTWLFIGPHPDDVELGCGGTICKHQHGNIKMFYVVVSPALEDKRNKHILSELEASAKILGLPRENITVWKYPRRVMHEKRSEIRQDLVGYVNRLNPDVIFTTSPHDLHQDHALVGEEVARLFRDRNLLAYEVVSNNSAFTPDFYESLGEPALAGKVNALLQYHSQRHRNYFNREVIYSLARTRGAQVKTQFAEAFKVLRMIVK